MLMVVINSNIIIEQVSWIKSSLLLMIQKQNTQTFQLFTKIIKKESIYKSNYNAKLDGLSEKAIGLIKSGRKRKCFKRSYLD
jgi:hypothetical protein